jgi:hypothetical protein
MSASIDCPICMDCIESTTRNCVTTECGHCFHTNCLMTSVAHNGFGCPYCRTAMAEEPEQDEETLWTNEDEEDEEEMFDDDALRGFRFFFNNIYGENHNEADIEEEITNEVSAQDVEQEDHSNVPTTDFVAQRLKEQGVTFEQLIHMLCNIEHEEYEDNDAAERFCDELFGKIRIIVSNYTPEQAAVSVQDQPTPVATRPAPVEMPEPEVDFAAQPKTTQLRVPRCI